MSAKNREEIKKEYLKNLNQDYRYSISKMDSQALFLSSGALGLSLAFIKDLVPINEAESKWIFLVSLWLFVIAIVLGLIGHQISSGRLAKRIQLVQDDRYDEIKEDKLIPRFNICLISIIILGIFSLVIFVSINVDNMSKKKITLESTQMPDIKIFDNSKIEQLSMPTQALPNVLRPTSQVAKPNNSGGKGSSTDKK